MLKRSFLSLAGLATLLIGCGQSSIAPPTLSERAAFLAAQPELKDAKSQALIAKFANDPDFLANVEQAYGGPSVVLNVPTVRTPNLRSLDLTSTRLTYVKSVGWGTTANYNVQYANRTTVNTSISGLDWNRDGCSSPSGLGLGYREDFRPACNVHDFGYRNLKLYERTDANRKTTDDAFRVNMNAICAAKAWYAKPACYSAAYAYYQAVRAGGASSF